MSKYNPNGMVIMNQRAPKLDWTTAHSKRASYLTHTFLDQNREAGDFQRETGMPYVVSRKFPFEPHANTDDLSKIRAYANDRFDDVRRLRDDAGNGNVLFQINNEQGFRRDDFLMYKFMVERSIELNDIIGMVFWNGASGTVTTGFWNQPNQWAEPWALEFIETMHRYRNVRLANGSYAFILGVHSYTSQYPLIAVNAGQHRMNSEIFKQRGFKNLWESHDAFLPDNDGVIKYEINWNLAQDHLARNYQGIMKALGWRPTEDGVHWYAGPEIVTGDDGQPVKCPWIISTEQGPDNMNDVRKVHWDDLVRIDELDTPRGFRSLMHTWPKDNWFPGKSAGEVLAYWSHWTHQVIYSKTGVHIGGHNYCLGDTSGPKFWWVSFNLWDTERGHGPAHDYFEAMEDDQYKVEIAPHFLGDVVTEPVPDPIVVTPPAPAQEPNGKLSKKILHHQLSSLKALARSIQAQQAVLDAQRLVLDSEAQSVQTNILLLEDILEVSVNGGKLP